MLEPEGQERTAAIEEPFHGNRVWSIRALSAKNWCFTYNTLSKWQRCGNRIKLGPRQIDFRPVRNCVWCVLRAVCRGLIIKKLV